ARWVEFGQEGLEDRSSRPLASPNQTPIEVEDLIESLRREYKIGLVQLAGRLRQAGYEVPVATIHRVLVRRGINHLRDIAPDGQDLRELVTRYEWARPGDMIHVDVKKVGRIRDGGGWRAHGRGSAQDRATRRQRAGYIYLHSATDDHSRLTYTEELTDARCDRCRDLATRRELAQTTPDRPDPPSSDRQRLLLPVMGLRRRAGGTEDPPQTHPSLLATNQRESRALPPHHGHRMALLTKLDQQPAPPPRAPGLARPLQLPSTTQLTRRPTTHQPLHLEH